MDKVKIIPVYDPQAIMRAWKFLVHGIEVATQRYEYEANLEIIFNMFMSGRALLWIAFLNNEYVGFVATEITDLPMVGRQLNIILAYKKWKADLDIIPEAFKVLEKFAIEQQCKRIHFWGAAKRWQELCEGMGYKTGHLEFIKELKDENLQ